MLNFSFPLGKTKSSVELVSYPSFSAVALNDPAKSIWNVAIPLSSVLFSYPANNTVAFFTGKPSEVIINEIVSLTSANVGPVISKGLSPAFNSECNNIG